MIFIIVCISLNNKNVLILLMHGANMKNIACYFACVKELQTYVCLLLETAT